MERSDVSGRPRQRILDEERRPVAPRGLLDDAMRSAGPMAPRMAAQQTGIRC